MNWFKGSIPEAIGTSRQRKCIFAVVVTAEQDENSQQLLARLEEKQVAELFNNFVSISLINGTTEAKQFSQLYPLVVLPSIYLIDLQGTPLEVIGGLVDASTLLRRAQTAQDLLHGKAIIPKSTTLQQAGEQASAAAQDETQTAQGSSSVASASEEQSANGGVAEDEGNNDSSPADLEARLERAKELLSAVRQKKAEEEREKEKAKERERRELGKQLQQFKEAQQERERRELAESRQKEKREEKEALEKIRQQIAQDRADRSARYHAAQASEEERRRAAQSAQEQLQQERASAARSAFARLQFRLPDGSTRTEQFDSDVKLRSVTDFIDREIQPPFKPYSLCTTFPRREFLKTEMESTLRDLGLAPSAALLIVPTSTGSSQVKSSTSGGIASLIQSVFAPLFWVWNWIFLFFFPPANPQVTQQPAPQQPAPQPGPAGNRGDVRRRQVGGNIRRLGDASADDSDDNATWNGNSTQQL